MLICQPEAQAERTAERIEKKMLRAMDSAVAGLRAHQNKLDVIGNNLANVNTAGYKTQSYNFQEAMYQTSTQSTAGSTQPGQTMGGANAAQYGYGSLMGSISMDMTESTPTYTGKFDAHICGMGFFITLPQIKPDGVDAAAMKTEDFAYTRVGQFKLNSDGYVVDGQNNFVYGFVSMDNGKTFSDGGTGTTSADQTCTVQVQDGVDADGKPIMRDETITVPKGKLVPLRVPSSIDFTDPNAPKVNIDNSGAAQEMIVTSTTINDAGEITVKVQSDDPAQDGKVVSIGKIAIASFQNPEGLSKGGNNTFSAKENDNTGEASATVPGGSTPMLMGGYVEGSNVDMANEFVQMITTQRGFQANSKIITVSDEILNELVNMKR